MQEEHCMLCKPVLGCVRSHAWSAPPGCALTYLAHAVGGSADAGSTAAALLKDECI